MDPNVRDSTYRDRDHVDRGSVVRDNVIRDRDNVIRERVVDRPAVQQVPVVHRERIIERKPVVHETHHETIVQKPRKKHFSKKWLMLGSLLLLGYLLSSLLPSHIFSRHHGKQEHFEVVEVPEETHEYYSAPHRFETESWRDVEASRWSPKQALGWFKSVLPNSLKSSQRVETTVDSHDSFDRRTRELIERFEHSGITGSMLAEMLKHGVDKDNNIFKQLLKIEEQGVTDYLTTELKKFTPTTVRHSSSRHVDHHDKFFGALLYYPLKWMGKSIAGFLKTFITVFELAGLLLLGVSLLSAVDSQKSLLRSASMIFDDIMLHFFNIFNKNISPVSKRDTSTTSAGVANVKPHSKMFMALKYLIGAPLAFAVGPFLYLTCFFYTVSRSMMKGLTSIAAPLIGLLLFKLVAPSWMWNPVSFILWHIVGGYGAITLLIRSYRSIFYLLKNHSTTIPYNSYSMKDNKTKFRGTTTNTVITPSTTIPSTTSSTGYGIESAPTAFPSKTVIESDISTQPTIVHRTTAVHDLGDIREKEGDNRDSVIKRSYVGPDTTGTTSSGVAAGRLGTSGA